MNGLLVEIIIAIKSWNINFQALFYMFVFRHKQLLELEGGMIKVYKQILMPLCSSLFQCISFK